MELAGVEVDDALGRALVGATLTTSGQVCFAAKRIFVADPIFDRVVDAFVAAAGAAVVGDGPAAVVGAADDNPVVATEQFGSAVPFLRFSSVEEAVARANASEYGLGASVWSADTGRARAIGARLEAGMVFLNRHSMAAAHPRGAFGGVKQSGYGRELGRFGVDSYTEIEQIVDPPAA